MKPKKALGKPAGLFLLLLVGGLVLTAPVTATPLTETTASGMAVIQNNPAAARDSAINDALRKAVEQAVGTMLSASTVSENFTVLRDTVYAQTRGYVQSYEIIDEKKEPPIYHVQVKAKVARARLKDDLSALGLLLSRKNMPRVMVMVAEQNVSQEHWVYWWDQGPARQASRTDLTVTENVLLRELGQKGFDLVDPAAGSDSLSLPEAYTTASLSNAAVKKIGSLFKADIVIYGKATAKKRGAVLESSLQSSVANVSLRAVRTDDGRVLASETAQAAAVHVDPITAGTKALTQATETIAGGLLAQLTQRWGKEVNTGGLMQLTLSGAVTYQNLMTLKQCLNERIRGVKNIYQREFSPGRALLDIQFTGPASTLADQLAQQSYDNFSVAVTGVSQNRVSLKLTDL